MVDHVADDFARPDSSSSLGSTSTGGVPWTVSNATWGILSGQAYFSASPGGRHVALVDTSTGEGKVAVDVVTPSGTYYVGGVAARGTDASHCWRGVLDSSVARLGYDNGSGWTEVWASGVGVYTPDTTYRLELTCKGTTIEFRIDGTLVHTETSSVLLGATGFGLAGDTYVSSWDIRWDNFDLELPQEASATFTGSGSFTGVGSYVEYPQVFARTRGIPGPHVDPAPGVVYPAPIVRPRSIPGPVAPTNPVLIRPITPMPIERVRSIPGPWMPERAPSDPTYPVIEVPEIGGGYYVDARLRADHDSSHLLAVDCQPRLNQVGTGSLTCLVPPSDGQTIGFTVAGSRVFTGIVTSHVAHEVAQGEEAAEVIEVSCDGQISEWSKVVVLPDFGAQDTNRLGPPNQDIRVFDWTMNGLGNEDYGETAATIIPSTSVDMIAAQEAFKHPIPDVWPDADARWMWVSDPLAPAPTGWCLFRVVTPARWAEMSVDFWLAASSYAELWVDGVPVVTCDQPYVAQKLRLDIDTDWHLVTIKARNASGGYPGVLFSMMPVETTTSGHYGQAIMNSRSGWKSVAYPDRTRTFISTPGQVVNRLVREANKRGATGVAGWRMSFGNMGDSAGRPWDRKEAIQIDVGKTYLDVLMQLSEEAVDWAEDPGSKTLHMWKKGEGSGRSVAVPWTEAVDLDSRDVTVTTR